MASRLCQRASGLESDMAAATSNDVPLPLDLRRGGSNLLAFPNRPRRRPAAVPIVAAAGAQAFRPTLLALGVRPDDRQIFLLTSDAYVLPLVVRLVSPSTYKLVKTARPSVRPARPSLLRLEDVGRIRLAGTDLLPP